MPRILGILGPTPESRWRCKNCGHSGSAWSPYWESVMFDMPMWCPECSSADLTLIRDPVVEEKP